MEHKGKNMRVKIILWKIPETETRTGDLTPLVAAKYAIIEAMDKYEK